MLKRIHRSISKKLLTSILLIGSAATLTITLTQLAFDYREEMGELEQTFSMVQRSYLPSIVKSVWDMDDADLKLAIEGLHHLTYLDFIVVKNRDGTKSEIGQVKSGQKYTIRDFPLENKVGDKIEVLGSLTIHANVQGIYTKLLRKSIIIFISQFLKTLLVSSLLYIVITKQLTQHIIRITQYLKEFKLSKLTQPLELNRTKSSREEEDEFDFLVASINQIKSDLIELYQDLEEKVKHRTEQLEIKNRELVQVSQHKSEFLANMSHEIRTPMNAILGFTSLLSESQLNEEQREHVELVQRSSKGLLTIINDILDFSKIESGKLSIEIREVTSKEIFDDVVQMFSEIASKKNLKLNYSLSPNFPEVVYVDTYRAKQILINLVGNAIKFTHQGEVHIRGEFEPLERDEVLLKISVRDTGIGIPTETQKDLFNPFVQADLSTTRKYGGTGLGLSICKRLVELMKGEIGVTSVPQESSTFWFTLRSMPSLAPKIHAANQTLQSEKTYEDFNILVAEDNPLNQLLIKKLLNKMKVSPVIVSTGREVLNLCAKETFDLILMDCHMPEMDGTQATLELRRSQDKNRPYIPIIAVTASSMESERQTCLNAGMDDFISKPVEFSVLAGIFEKWLKPKTPVQKKAS